MKKNIVVCARCLKGRTPLILEEGIHYWQLPSSETQRNESLKEAAVRGFFEKTGIVLPVTSLYSSEKFETYAGDLYFFHATVLYFKFLKDQGPRGERVRMFLYDELATTVDFFPAHRRYLREFINPQLTT